MSNPIAKIAAGVAAAETATTTDPIPNPFTGLAGTPATLTALIELASAADLRAQSLDKAFERLEGDIAKRTSEAERRWSTAPGLSRDQRESFVSKEAQAARKEIVATSENERLTAIRELQAIAKQVSSGEDLFASPVRILSREGLGTEERSRIQMQVAHAGAQELHALAKYATASGNRVLAAAVASRFQTLPRDQRPFSVQHLAEALVGAEYARAAEMFAIAKNRAQNALNRNRSFVSGRPGGIGTIVRAITRPAEGEGVEAAS